MWEAADTPNVTKEQLQGAVDQRFSREIRQRLAEARVGIAGLGGLGSHIAVMLARTGVGTLHLVDFDVVDLTNLNRQQYFLPQLGQEKTHALCQLLRQINPYLTLLPQTVRVTEENAGELFREDPILCEAFDQPEQKAMLVSTVLEQCPNTTVISGSGMAGYGSANDIHSRKAARRLYLCGDETTDLALFRGLMAPRVSVCAGHQANLAVRLILGEETP